ncbi:MAG: hypothetical protein JJU48_00750 [Methylophaga sp.]|nr:hypothetical protein [Methylophaga sp.]
MKLSPVCSAIIVSVLMGGWPAPEMASASQHKSPENSKQQVDANPINEASISQPSSPCDNVVELAIMAKNAREAEFILGACLAAPGPSHMHLQAAHALMLLSDEQEMACAYAAIIEDMLEYPQPKVKSSTLEKIETDTQRQACLCVRKSSQNLSTMDFEEIDRIESSRQFEISQWHSVTSSTRMPDFNYELQVHQHRTMDHLCVFAGDEVRYFESRGTITRGFQEIDFFVHAETDTPIAVIIWRLGVHGQALQLLDLDAGEQILQRNSEWPVTYKILNNQIKYQYHQAIDGNKPEVIDERY